MAAPPSPRGKSGERSGAPAGANRAERSALASLGKQRSGLAGFLSPRSPGLETSNKVGRP